MLSIAPHGDRPYEQGDEPAGVALPPQPGKSADKHRQRADLRKRQHEYHRRQHRRERDAGNRKTDSAQHRLHQRGDNHAERDTSYCLAGEAHDVLARDRPQGAGRIGAPSGRHPRRS
jgi:hypothetical protein